MASYLKSHIMSYALRSVSRHNSLIAGFLIANFVFSVYRIWGTLWQNGYFEALIHLWNHGPYVLPGSSNPILTTYTPIRPFDQLVTFSIVLFANVTDGSLPQFSLFAFHFTGQWASILIIVLLEGLREGNKGLFISL